jgi:hypothetical protein
MADIRWHLEGKWLEYCSCDFGCPCESMANPTQGHCTGVVAMKIDEGYYGDVRLDGQLVVATFFFPRAIHHGGGSMQPILEERATEKQRDALFKILSGENQPKHTIFSIFSVIIERHLDPIFTNIEFEWDVKARRARLSIPGEVQAATVPIRNPVTDREERIRTVLPEGWNFYEAEVAAGTSKSIGAIKFDLAHRHSSLAFFAFNNEGMAYSYNEAKERYGLDHRA